MSDNKADALADIEKVKEVATSSNSFRETILVVEDDKTTRDIIVEYLLDKLPGLSIETASDGVEALDKIAERVPSILITNINMPRMNGIDLLKILHERGISIPTLVTSGWWTQEAFEKELAERGVAPEKKIVFLKKPFQLEQIVVLLEKLRQGGNNNLGLNNRNPQKTGH